MRVNVEKVLERDQKLSELDDRAGINIIIFFVSHSSTSIKEIEQKNHYWSITIYSRKTIMLNLTMS